MSVRVKPGVEFAVVAPAGFMILAAIKKASKDLGIDLTITSGTDGKHSGPSDPHYTGNAIDLRSNDLDAEHKAQVLNAIMGQLEFGRFSGFLEGMNTPNEHFHFQVAKNTTFSVEDFLNA